MKVGSANFYQCKGGHRYFKLESAIGHEFCKLFRKKGQRRVSGFLKHQLKERFIRFWSCRYKLIDLPPEEAVIGRIAAATVITKIREPRLGSPKVLAKKASEALEAGGF